MKLPLRLPDCLWRPSLAERPNLGAVIAALAISAVAVLHMGLPARAAEPNIPIFADLKERLPKPDLSNLERLRFLTTVDFPPFNYIDDAGRLAGFHIDLARAICVELAIADRCEIQALPWQELQGALQAGQGEAIVAGLAATAEARSRYVFTRPYLQFPARLVVPVSTAMEEPLYDKLASQRIGVMGGSAHERMLRRYFPEAVAVPYERQETMLADLKAGKVDGVFGDGMRLSFWLGDPSSASCCHFAGGPYLAPHYLGSGLAIAVGQDDAALAAAIDYALQQITVHGTFAELYLRYFPISFF